MSNALKMKSKPAKVADEAVPAEKPIERMMFASALELREYYGNVRCKIETPKDIKLITERQEILDKAFTEFNEKIRAIEVPEGMTDEKSIMAFRQEQANTLMYQQSSLTRTDVQFFTFQELLEGIKDQPLSNKAVSFMFYWLVKPEE